MCGNKQRKEEGKQAKETEQDNRNRGREGKELTVKEGGGADEVSRKKKRKNVREEGGEVNRTECK